MRQICVRVYTFSTMSESSQKNEKKYNARIAAVFKMNKTACDACTIYVSKYERAGALVSLRTAK